MVSGQAQGPLISQTREGTLESGPFVLQPGEGRSIDLDHFVMTVKAAADTGGAFSLLESNEPPNFGPPLHIHRNATEAFYILEGEYTMFVGEEEFRCPAGSFVFIPAGVIHGFRVGQVASRKLTLFVPEAMIGYFDDLAAAIKTGNVDDAQLGEIAERYGMTVLGPVPDGYA